VKIRQCVQKYRENMTDGRTTREHDASDVVVA